MFSVLTKYAASISLSFAFILFLKENTCNIVSHLFAVQCVLIKLSCLNKNAYIHWTEMLLIHDLSHRIINVLN
jgi:hypothetical protein